MPNDFRVRFHVEKEEDGTKKLIYECPGEMGFDLKNTPQDLSLTCMAGYIYSLQTIPDCVNLGIVKGSLSV